MLQNRDPAKIKPAGSEVMRNGQIAERPVDRGRQSRILQPGRRSQPVGITYECCNVEIVREVASQIDRALASHIQSAGDGCDVAFENARFQRAIHRQREFRANRPGKKRLASQLWGKLTQKPVNTRIVRQLKARDTTAFIAVRVFPHDESMAKPLCPRTVPLDPCIVGGVQSRDLRKRAIGGGAIVKGEIEAVAIRLCIEQQVEPVLPAKRALCIDERAAFANVDLRGEVDALRFLSGHTGSQRQVVDLEPIDADVEIRQDRRVRVAWQQLGQAQQLRPARGQFAHIEPAPEPGQWPPAEFHLGNGEEGSFGVFQHHIVQHSIAVDIALDPSDFETEPRCRCDLRDLIGDEPLADRRGEECPDDKDRQHHDRDRPAEPLCPATLAFALGRIDLCVLDHQNA